MMCVLSAFNLSRFQGRDTAKTVKKLVLGWLGRAARLVRWLRAEATPNRDHAHPALFATAHRCGREAVVCSLRPNDPDDVMALRVDAHFAHMVCRAPPDVQRAAESSQALLAWVALVKLLAASPEGERILSELKGGFAVGGTDDVLQQEARAFVVRELATLKHMVALAKGAD